MIQVQRSVVTNPAKEGLVSITSTSSDLGDYLRKVNSIKTLDNANLKLVMTIARKAIHVSKLPMTDLIQEGNLGLMIAADKFNPDLGYRFSTYATWWIKQAMFKAISEQSYCMKIPV